MKRLLYLLLILNLCPMVMAVDWLELTTPTGKVVQLDLDSITESDGCLFYNIKNQESDSVLTIQSGLKKPFSAKIDTIKQSDYTGDYSTITKNQTKDLGPVAYSSVVYTCYKKAKEVLYGSKNQIQIMP